MLENKLETIERLDFFEFLDILFTDAKRYKTLSKKEKARHFFMTNRRFAIAYPIQAQAANKIGMNPVAIMDKYHNAFCGDQKPRWVFTSAAKNNGDDRSDGKYINECMCFDREIIKTWLLSHNNSDYKSFKDSVRMHPRHTLKELKNILAETTYTGGKKSPVGQQTTKPH